jgi:hypothetical protein
VPTGESTEKRPPTFGGTLLRIGHEGHVPAYGESRLAQPGAHRQILRHRLRGAPRFGDHQKARAREVHPIEHRTHRARVDVVEHVEPRTVAAARGGERVPVAREQRRPQRHRAERRPADAEHDHVVGAMRLVPRPPLHPRPLGRLRLELAEAEHAARRLRQQVRVCAVEVRAERGEVLRRGPARHRTPQHAGDIELDGHASWISTVSPS